MAVSLWTWTKSSKSSTSNTAAAVSTTRHTTTAEISMGLPSASLTLETLVVKLCTRSEILRDSIRVKGLARCQPGVSTVPL